MGTASEWLSVLVWGGLWGAGMAWWAARQQDASQPRRDRMLNLAIWAPAGLWFGIVTTFGWQAWHRPLLFVNVAAFVSMFVVGWISRKRRSNNATHPAS